MKAETVTKHSIEKNKKEIENIQIDALNKHLFPMVCASLSGVLVVSVLCWDKVPQYQVTAWVTAHVLLGLARIYMSRKMTRERKAGKNTWTNRGRMLIIGTLISAALWGICGWQFIPVVGPLEQMFISFVICGMALGAIGSLSTHMSGLYSYIFIILTPTVLGLVMAGDEVRHGMAIMVAIFGAALISFGRNINAIFMESVSLRFERAQLRDALTLSEQRLRDAIDQMPAALSMFDANDRLVVWNGRASALTPGHEHLWREGTASEALLWAAFQAKVIDLGEDPATWIENRKRRHHAPEGPEDVHLADGRWLRVIESRTRDGGFLTIHVDVTEIKRNEAELMIAKEQAELASRAKSQFLALMSHELRTPLNAILGFAEVIRDQVFGSTGDPRYADYAADIHSSGEHLLSVINDILDLSKIEAGRMELSREKINIAYAVNTTLRLMDGRAKEAGIHLEADIAPDLPALFADARAFRQMLFNLLSNAVKFTPAGGRVTVSARLVNGTVVLSVADTGIGIAKEDMSAVLQPFGQVGDVLDRRDQGTGLGVPIVKSLIELHGGWFNIESELGVGTVIHLHFPPAAIASAA